jgi:hypothetical protein
MSWESRHKEGIGGTASCSSAAIVKNIIIPVLLRFSKLDDAITVVAAVVVVDVALMFDVHARSWAKLDLD